MNKNKPHKNWKLFLESSQLPLGPLKGAPIKARPSMRVDPKDPDPDHEQDLSPTELGAMFQTMNSKSPGTGMQKVDSDFNMHPNEKLKISLKTDSEQSFANSAEKDKEDKKAKDRIQSFWDVAQYTDTIDLRNLEEMIREELIRLLNETDIRREK